MALGLSEQAPPRRRMSGRRQTAPAPPLRGVPDRSDYIEHRAADGRRVFVHHGVLADLFRLERSRHPDETAGLLFGGFFADRGTSCAVVTDLILPVQDEVLGTPSTVTITAHGADRMIARAWLRNPLLQVLGWGHTHPRFEAYFSVVDREEQSAWKHPASVGIVVSGLPSAEEPYKVFVGPEASETVAARRLPLQAIPTSPHTAAQGAASVRADRGAPSFRSGRGRRLPPGKPARLPLAVAAVLVLAVLCVSTLAWISAVEARNEVHAARTQIRTLQKRAFGNAAGRAVPDTRVGQPAAKKLFELNRGW